MLASVAFDAATGDLVVTGDNFVNDTIALVGSADFNSFTVSISDNPGLTQSFNYADVNSLKVFAGGGDEQ